MKQQGLQLQEKLKEGQSFGLEFFLINLFLKNLLRSGWEKGKGDIDRYVAPIKKGTMLYEIAGVDEDLAREALRLHQQSCQLELE